MTMMLYKLTPRGAFHFGERGIGLEETADFLHSDTLFSALVSAWRALGETPDPDAVLPSVRPYLASQPSIHISSGLPFAGDVVLFPRPMIGLGLGRAHKRITFVSEQALDLLAQGDEPNPEYELIQGGHVWVTADERQRIQDLVLSSLPLKLQRRLRARIEEDPTALEIWWGNDSQPVPHVAIDRVTAESNLYHTAHLRFAEGCGLAFWATSQDAAHIQRIEDGLAFLEDEGLGGQRSSGYGQFSTQRVERELPTIHNPNAWVTLSLYLPAGDEVAALDESWYRRILRRGWIYSPDGKNLRRRAVWMLAEGAVLPAAAVGRLIDTRPEIGFSHPIWRSGLAFCMPIRLEELER
jgi:CRISPR-associated protein Csm4